MHFTRVLYILSVFYKIFELLISITNFKFFEPSWRSFIKLFFSLLTVLLENILNNVNEKSEQ